MTNLWENFERDPRDQANGSLRASDRDRDVVREVFASAFAEGRLTHEEFDERTDQINAARTLGDLPGLVADLVPVSATAPTPSRAVPADLQQQAEERYARARHQALLATLFPSIICWVVWISVLLSGYGTAFPWPVFVTLGTGWRWFDLASNRQVALEGFRQDIVKKLAREERRRLQGGQQTPRELDNPGDE